MDLAVRCLIEWIRTCSVACKKKICCDVQMDGMMVQSALLEHWESMEVGNYHNMKLCNRDEL